MPRISATGPGAAVFAVVTAVTAAPGAGGRLAAGARRGALGGGGDAGGGAGGDDGVAADAGHGEPFGFHRADDFGGGLHGDAPAGHHFPLGRQPVAVVQFAGGDLGAQLPDHLHVQRDRPVQLGRPVTHLPSGIANCITV